MKKRSISSHKNYNNYQNSKKMSEKIRKQQSTFY